jgi:hypothetical protein
LGGTAIRRGETGCQPDFHFAIQALARVAKFGRHDADDGIAVFVNTESFGR